MAQRGQLPPRHLRNHAGPVVAAVHGLIVADDDPPVSGHVRVGFNVTHPGLVCVRKRGHRVLGSLLAATPMGENDGSLTHSHGHHEQDSCPR